MFWLLTAVAAFFVAAVVADALILLFVRQSMSRLSDNELLTYRIKTESRYIREIYIRALNEEINRRFGK